jgi:hypothetical protein
MSLSRIVVWISGQVLYASDLNAEFNSIVNYINNNLLMVSGTEEIDFGEFPGAPEAGSTVFGQPSITITSLIRVWIHPVATADHSADEHNIESIKVFVGHVIAGGGFTFYAQCALGGKLYGKFNIAWDAHNL